MTDSEVIFSWRHHPWVEQPKRAIALVVVLLAVAGLIGATFRSAGWSIISLLILTGSVHRFWLPTTYRISETELERRQWWIKTSRPWSEFKRAVLLENAVFLSPSAEPSRLDGHRGWLILTPQGDRKFAEWVKARIPIRAR